MATKTRTTPETRLIDRIRRLESLIQNWPTVLLEDEVWRYVEALGHLHHMAHHGIRRPDDLGGSITGSHASSTGTRYANEPLAQLRQEQRHLATRTTMINAELSRLDPNDTIAEAG